MRNATLAALAAAPVLALAAAAPPALAHTEVTATNPARGATAPTGLRSVTVTFSAPIQQGTLKVTGPGKVRVSKGSGGRDPRKVSRLRVALKGGKAAGRYKARWTIRAADGHAQHGTFRFRLG